MIRIPLLLFILFVSDSVCSGQSQEMQKTFQYKLPQFLYEEKCVADMRNLARQRFKKDWFTSDEFKLIVNLLVKTQGLRESESSVPENINKK